MNGEVSMNGELNAHVLQFLLDIFDSIKTIENKHGFKISVKHYTDITMTAEIKIDIHKYEIFYDFEDELGYIQNKYDESIIFHEEKLKLFKFLYILIMNEGIYYKEKENDTI